MHIGGLVPCGRNFCKHNCYDLLVLDHPHLPSQLASAEKDRNGHNDFWRK